MSRPLDPATHQALAERLRFYRDLGLTDFYRRDVEPLAAIDDPKLGRSVAEELAEREALLRAAIADVAQSAAQPSAEPTNISREEATIKTRKTNPAPEIGAVIPAENRAAALRLVVSTSWPPVAWVSSPTLNHAAAAQHFFWCTCLTPSLSRYHSSSKEVIP